MPRPHVVMAAATLLLAGAADASGQPTGTPIAVDPSTRLAVGPVDGRVTPFLSSTGHLAVPSRENGTISVHAEDGRRVASHGGTGRRLGEFMALRSAWARGDTIEAFDWSLQRITRFLPGGGIEVIPVARPAASDAGSRPLQVGSADEVLAPLGPGWALTAILAVRWDARDQMGVLALARDGLTHTRVAVAEGMRRELYSDGSGPHPLSPTALFAVHRDEVYVTETLTRLIRVYDATGELRREVPVPLAAPQAPGAISRLVVDSAEAIHRAQPGGPPVRWSGLEPGRLSIFWDLVVDELGFLWVRPYDPWKHSLALDGRPGGHGGPGGRWLVLSPEGAEVAWIDVPDGLEIAQVTSDAVVGIHHDDQGFASARVHRLSRR